MENKRLSRCGAGWCYWWSVWGDETEASWHHWHVYQLNNSCTSAEVVWHKGSTTLSPSSGRCNYFSCSHRQIHMEFSTLGKGRHYFFFRRLGLRNCYFLPLCSGETCSVQTTQPLIDKWSLEAGNSFSGTNSLFLCAKQHNIKRGVISCSSMRYNCSFLLEITGRSGRSQTLWNKYSFTASLLFESEVQQRPHALKTAYVTEQK